MMGSKKSGSPLPVSRPSVALRIVNLSGAAFFVGEVNRAIKASFLVRKGSGAETTKTWSCISDFRCRQDGSSFLIIHGIVGALAGEDHAGLVEDETGNQGTAAECAANIWLGRQYITQLVVHEEDRGVTLTLGGADFYLSPHANVRDNIVSTLALRVSLR